MKRALAIAALIIGAVTLPACGLTGELKRPDPLWGDPSGDIDPAELPDTGDASLPKLPPREEQKPADSEDEDELLGGLEE
ncbi:MAG: hypothetical protein KDA53_02900 [Hyphomonas sp.]|nr:hypothetical protein [Hyphomonas sp.]